MSVLGDCMSPHCYLQGFQGEASMEGICPSGYAVCASESGYISTKLFADYGEKFVKFLRESNLMTPGIKHEVLLDLHNSHLFNSSYMEYMQANNIEVWSFPPHCTHILQPLDDLPYAMLKRKFQKELISFNLQVSGEKLSKQQFFRVLIPAFSGAFQPEVIRKGFKNTGIYPLNQDAPKFKQLGSSQVYDKCKSNAVNCSFWTFQILVTKLVTLLILYQFVPF